MPAYSPGLDTGLKSGGSVSYLHDFQLTNAPEQASSLGSQQSRVTKLPEPLDRTDHLG